MGIAEADGGRRTCTSGASRAGQELPSVALFLPGAIEYVAANYTVAAPAPVAPPALRSCYRDKHKRFHRPCADRAEYRRIHDHAAQPDRRRQCDRCSYASLIPGAAQIETLQRGEILTRSVSKEIGCGPRLRFGLV